MSRSSVRIGSPAPVKTHKTACRLFCGFSFCAKAQPMLSRDALWPYEHCTEHFHKGLFAFEAELHTRRYISYQPSAADHSASRKPTSTKSSATIKGRFTSIPYSPNKMYCSIVRHSRQLVLQRHAFVQQTACVEKKRRRRQAAFFSCQARSSSAFGFFLDVAQRIGHAMLIQPCLGTLAGGTFRIPDQNHFLHPFFLSTACQYR